MKKVLLSIAALALSASVANASVITYTFSLNDVNAQALEGDATPALDFGIYATVSSGDNFGIASFHAAINPANLADLEQEAAAATYVRSTGTAAQHPNKNVGFTLLPAASIPTGEISASQDTVSAQGALNSPVMVYGVGQAAGDLDTLTPASYKTASASGLSPTVTTFALPILIGFGKFTATPSQTMTAAQAFGTAGGGNFANLFTTNTGTTTSAATTVTLAITGGAVVASASVDVSAGGTGTNQGTVSILTSGPNKYAGIIKKITAANSGNVALSDIGSENGTEVLMWFSGTDTAAQLAAALTVNGTGATVLTAGTDSDSTHLFSVYSTLATAAGGLDNTKLLLFRFPNAGAANNFFDFTLPAADSVIAVTAVPEPASLGLLALGGLGLIARRRSSKK